MANEQTIQKFYTTAAQKDFARVFQFRLQSFGNVSFATEHLTYVETASLPGRSITNVTVPYMGLAFNVPGTVSYPGSASYSVTFRCDQNYDLRAALETATFNTFNEQSSSGQFSLPEQGTILQMDLLGKDMNPLRTYQLHGVYVQSLADAAYDIKDTGSVQTIQATLAYQYWTASTVNLPPGSPTRTTTVPSWASRSVR